RSSSHRWRCVARLAATSRGPRAAAYGPGDSARRAGSAPRATERNPAPRRPSAGGSKRQAATRESAPSAQRDTRNRALRRRVSNQSPDLSGGERPNGQGDSPAEEAAATRARVAVSLVVV